MLFVVVTLFAGALWQADAEEGTLHDWQYTDANYAGGGAFNTGGSNVIARASNKVARFGDYSYEATIRNVNGNARAVRLMRSTDKPWDFGGEFLPKRAYYSTWLYFDDLYNPAQWWNIFQFKSKDKQNNSQPVWSVNVSADNSDMWLRLYTKINGSKRSYTQDNPIKIAPKTWVHLEALYIQGKDRDGRIAIWQDGTEIFDVRNVNTALHGNLTWGIGSYTDEISDSRGRKQATVYFDDAAISTKPTHCNAVIPEPKAVTLIKSAIVFLLFIHCFVSLRESRAK